MNSKTISHYKVLSKLGSGGMGEVYLAEDLQLGRKIALKMLPEELTRDSGRINRLEQEARTASSLNHPNIVVVHELGQAEGAYFIATELIEGDTLRQRIDRGPLTIQETLDIVLQVATALNAAHSAGVIHRDVKPENIMLRPDGIVKVLDFGLAKPVSISEIATMQATTTGPGFVLGTLPYMSPEQARGLPLDVRTDIFSLGVTLYEMLSGSRPFQGKTPSDTLVQVLQDHPPAMHSSVPETLRWIIEKSLLKEREDRYQTIREMLADLKNFKQRIEFEAQLEHQTTAGITAAPVMPVSARLMQLTFAEEVEQSPEWSPDATQLFYCRDVSGVRKIFRKDVDSGNESQITHGPYDDIQPACSPDGATLLFVRGRVPNVRLEPGDVFGIHSDPVDLYTLNLSSGKESKLLENAYNPAFSADGKSIAFDASWAGPRRIWIANRNGYNPQQVTSDMSEAMVHIRPRWSPDGERIVFQNIERTKFDIRVATLQTRDIVWVTNDLFQDLNPVWSPSGRFIYFSSYRSGGLNLWRIRVAQEGKPFGAPQQVTAGAGQDVEVTISRDGKRLAFSTLKQNADIWKLPVDPASGIPAGSPVAVIAGSREESRGAWSPDGAQIAFNSDRGGSMNIWLYSARDNSIRQLTRGAGGDFQPNWSPDGTRLVYFSSRSGFPGIWGVEIATGEVRELAIGHCISINPFYSRDGRWIAYQSDQSGRLEIWVMQADGSNLRQVTNTGCGGHFLRWSRKSDSLIYYCPFGNRRVLRVRLDGEESETLPEVAGGSHLSFSPDHSRIMDVVGHKTLWVSPLQSGVPEKVFEFENPTVRIDYPVWSPDGAFILFDYFVPRGGDIWMMEDFEQQS